MKDDHEQQPDIDDDGIAWFNTGDRHAPHDRVHTTSAELAQQRRNLREAAARGERLYVSVGQTAYDEAGIPSAQRTLNYPIDVIAPELLDDAHDEQKSSRDEE